MLWSNFSGAGSLATNGPFTAKYTSCRQPRSLNGRKVKQFLERARAH